MTGIIQERAGAVLLIRMDTAPSGLMTAKLCAQLVDVFEGAVAEEDVRVIVMAGAEAGVFIRHYDVGSIVRSAEALQAGAIMPEAFAESVVFRAFQAVARCPKPVIAAINGVCMGGGFELALCCSYRVAQPNVREIGAPETRIGIFPGSGGTQRLPRILGEARALAFILQGEVVCAEEALKLGLVCEIAPDAVAHAMSIAQDWSTRAPALLSAVVPLVRGACDRPLGEGLKVETLAFAHLLRDEPAALAGMRAFLESGMGLGDA